MDAGEDEPFEVQTAEDIRLTRNKDQLLLHNVATGEVAVVEESKNWTSVELLTVDGEGVVLRGSNNSGEVQATSISHWLQFEKNQDDLVDLGDGSRSQWSDMVKTTVPLALSLSRGQSVFTCELQVAKVPNVSSCTIFWHIRCIVDWLGGHKNSNFVGQGAKTWTNKVLAYLPHVPDLDEEHEIDEIARKHFLESGHSRLRASPRQGEDADQEVRMTEYCASSFAILVMLAHWAARGPHKRSQWKLSIEQVQSQATSLLKVLLHTFVTADLRMEVAEATIWFCLVDDDVCLEWEQFCLTESLALLQRVFDSERRVVPVHEAIMVLCLEEINTRVSQSRRAAATMALAWLIQALVWVLESSKRDEIWHKTELWQLQPLRTSFFSGCFLSGEARACFHRLDQNTSCFCHGTETFFSKFRCVGDIFSDAS